MKLRYLSFFLLLASCNSGDSLEEKKAQLDKLKADLVTLNQEIQSLESEIKAKDPDYENGNGLYTLVAAFTLQPQPFEHKFEMRGSVESRKNVQISAEAMGRVESIFVREGDRVSKGQRLMTLDATVLQNSIEELKTALSLATTVFNKRERLWKQNIGSEIQYLEAKTNKESLERQLATAQSQLRQYRVIAPFTGVVDEVQAKLGEMAQPGLPLLRIVSVDDMHLEADVSETYLGAIKRGDSVDLYFPSFGEKMSSVVTATGLVINPQNRTFTIQVALPASDIPYKPNLVAVLEIRDYYQEQSLVVPSSLIQQDNKGDYVYILQEGAEGPVARKLHIEVGRTYEANSEVLAGLEPGMQVIENGHREVTDGGLVQLAEREIQ